MDFVRIGTRIPVTYPLRLFDDALIEVLRAFAERKALYIATHYNHTREITPTSTEAIKRLRLCGAVINNQAVLLRGVNDTAQDIAGLMNRLLAIGVNPYYLYQCMGGTTTYALGWVFDRHFRKGGNLVDFDAEEAKTYFKEKVEEGKTIIGKIKKKVKKDAAVEAEAPTKEASTDAA